MVIAFEDNLRDQTATFSLDQWKLKSTVAEFSMKKPQILVFISKTKGFIREQKCFKIGIWIKKETFWDCGVIENGNLSLLSKKKQ